MSHQHRLLDDENRRILKNEYWSRLEKPVKLVFFTSQSPECQYCDLVEQILDEITDPELTNKIEVMKVDFDNDLDLRSKLGILKAPAVVIQGVNKGLIKYYGVPAGTEFPTFLETIVHVSNGDVHLPQSVAEEVESLEDKVNIKVFVTTACPYCPKMLHSAYMFAMVNRNVEAEGWEVSGFPDIAQSYGVYAVPKVVVNDKVSWEGAVPPEHLLRKVKEAI